MKPKKISLLPLTLLLMMTFSFAAKTAGAADFEIKLPPNTEPEQIFWIAADGDDAAAGTQDAPFATLRRGVEAVQAFRRSEPTRSVGVFIKPGEYAMSETVALDGLKGTPEKPILFRRAPGAKENPLFTGGRNVGGWEKLASSEFWKNASERFKKRIRPEAVEKIWVAPYEGFATATYDPGKYGGRQEFFAANRPQTPARWPNDSFAHAGKALGATPIKSWASVGTKEGFFEADEAQPTGWNDESDALLFGYWFWDWSESFERLEQIDEAAKTIKTKEPYHGYGYKDGLRYIGFNLLCELDNAGEYYIDRPEKKIFWIPPERFDPSSGAARIATFERPWMIEMKNCDSVVFAGLSFTEGFGGAVKIEESDNILLADSQFARFGRDALKISGGVNCGVYHCLLETLGCGGIDIAGGDRKTLVDARHFVAETTVREFSRIKRTYAPAVLATGCGMKFARCDFSRSSSSAMRLEGNEFLIEYSRFSNLVDESDDQGAIDVFFNPTYRGNIIRYNRWENIVGGTHCGAAAIRFDDMISGYTVFGNVFVHCGAVQFGAVQIHGGKENLIENNVFLDCRAAASFLRWGKGYTDAFTDPENRHYGAIKKKCHEEVDIESAVWKERYPSVEKIAVDPDVNTVRNNLLVNCEEKFLRGGDTLIQENNSEIKLDGTDESTIVAPENLAKYGLQPIPLERMGPSGAAWLTD